MNTLSLRDPLLRWLQTVIAALLLSTAATAQDPEVTLYGSINNGLNYIDIDATQSSTGAEYDTSIASDSGGDLAAILGRIDGVDEIKILDWMGSGSAWISSAVPHPDTGSTFALFDSPMIGGTNVYFNTFLDNGQNAILTYDTPQAELFAVVISPTEVITGEIIGGFRAVDADATSFGFVANFGFGPAGGGIVYRMRDDHTYQPGETGEVIFRSEDIGIGGTGQLGLLRSIKLFPDFYGTRTDNGFRFIHRSLDWTGDVLARDMPVDGANDVTPSVYDHDPTGTKCGDTYKFGYIVQDGNDVSHALITSFDNFDDPGSLLGAQYKRIVSTDETISDVSLSPVAIRSILAMCDNNVWVMTILTMQGFAVLLYDEITETFSRVVTPGPNGGIPQQPEVIGARDFGVDPRRSRIWITYDTFTGKQIGRAELDAEFQRAVLNLDIGAPFQKSNKAPKASNGPITSALLNIGSTIRVQSNDASTGAVISNIPYLNPNWRSVGVVDIPGLGPNGNGIGVYALRRTDSVPILQIKDPMTGNLIQNVFPLSRVWTIADMQAVPNNAPGGGPALAVLGIRNNDGLFTVQIIDAETAQVLRFIYPLGQGWQPVGMAIIPDIGGNGPAVAVLCSRLSDGLTIAQVRDIATGDLISNVFPLGLGFTPQEMVRVFDANGNGNDDLAIRMRRRTDALEVVQVRDPLNNALINNLFPLSGSWGTFSMQGVSINGVSALGVLSAQNTGQMLAQVQNIADRSIVKNTFFLGPSWEPFDFFSTRDFSGNLADELSVLARNKDTQLRLIQTRDSQTSELIRNIQLLD